MPKLLSTLYYRSLAYLFYYLGDLSWRVPINLGYILYGKCMMLSIEYDDLSGNKIWKAPDKEYYIEE